jgi:hypothetical protein
LSFANEEWIVVLILLKGVLIKEGHVKKKSSGNEVFQEGKEEEQGQGNGKRWIDL